MIVFVVVEVGIGIVIVLMIFRNCYFVDVDEFDLMKY